MTESRQPVQSVNPITVAATFTATIATTINRRRCETTRLAVGEFIHGRCGSLLAIILLTTALPVDTLRADFDSGLKAFGEGRLDEARQAWQKSAVDGHAISQYLLAELYENGNGVSADSVQAHRWYCAAAAGGYAGAAQACARLARIVQTRTGDLEVADNASQTPQSTDSDWPGDRYSPELTDQTLPVGSLQLAEVVHSHPGDLDRAPESESQPVVSESTPSQAASSDNLEIESDVLLMQQLLNQLGHDVGVADGLMGRNTRLAVIAFKNIEVPVAADQNATATTPLSSHIGSDW